MGISEFRHQFATFDVPKGNKTSIISGYNSLEFIIIQCKTDRIFMRSLYFFLCFKLFISSAKNKILTNQRLTFLDPANMLLVVRSNNIEVSLSSGL
jgi:hypothetical protein